MPSEEPPRPLDPEVVAFGKAVAYWRRKANLTQAKLAERTGLHASVVGFIEQGVREVGVGKVAPIARALGLEDRAGVLFLAISDDDDEGAAQEPGGSATR